MKGKVTILFVNYANTLGVDQAFEKIERELPTIFEHSIGKILNSKRDYNQRLELLEKMYNEYQILKNRSKAVWLNVYQTKLFNSYSKTLMKMKNA